MAAFNTITAELCALGLAEAELPASLCHLLLERFENIEAIWAASTQTLESFMDDSTLARLNYVRDTLDLEQRAQEYANHHVHWINTTEETYPVRLKESPDPPFVLFVKGNAELLDHPRTLGVVGTRQCTPYGEQATRIIIEQLTKLSPLIISGLALGIDTHAHQAALDFACPTVAVFATGLDEVYPKANRALARQILEAGGALISEFPFDSAPERYRFPQRNRIVAGLSEGVLIVEGPFKSGALITARNALEADRQVFAVPGSMFSSNSLGPNHLIRQGAIPVTSGVHIAQDLRWVSDETAEDNKRTGRQLTLNLDAFKSHFKYSGELRQDNGFHQTEAQPVYAQPDGPPLLQSIYEHLSLEPVAFDALLLQLQATEAGLSTTDFSAALTMLEMQGWVKALAGGQYIRVIKTL